MEDWKLEKMIELSDILETPDGFRREEDFGCDNSKNPWMSEPPSIKFFAEDGSVEVFFRFDFSDYDRKQELTICGTTNFVMPNGKRFTFDRRGISDSFYFGTQSYNEPLSSANKILAEQIELARDGIIRRADAEDVPGLQGFNITQEKKKRMTEELKAGRVVQLAPGGMGIGYHLSKLKSNLNPGRWGARKAADAMAKFFNCTTLWIEEFDHD